MRAAAMRWLTLCAVAGCLAAMGIVSLSLAQGGSSSIANASELQLGAHTAGSRAAFVRSPLAVPFTVTKTADTNDGTCDGDCSLREAIKAANTAAGADTITLPAGTYQLTIANSGGTNEDNNATGDLDVNDSLTIQGAGSGSTIIEAGTDNTNGIDKVIALNPFCTTAINATIDGVTVRFGRNTQPSGAPDFSFTGGGIDWCSAGAGGTFTFTNSVVSDNTNVNGYGGGLNVDTVSSPTTVNITNVTFQNNKTLSTVNTANGGAINLFGDSPSVNITNSTFTGNLTTNATSGGGAIYFRPTTVGHLSISGSTFSSNTAAGIGGAIATDNHGTSSTVSIQTSTFSGNTATNSFGGAMKLDGTELNTTAFSLTHLKIIGNTAGISGGGIFVGNSNVAMSKSLIVGNTAPTGKGLHKSVDAATATLTNNWWGCSTGPGAAPCDTATTAGGTLTFTPWYRNQLTASPSPVAVNQSTSLTSSFLTNSANSAVPVADLAEVIGRSVTWAATHGNLSSTQGTVQAAGTATGSFQATSAGTAVISAKVDNDNTSPVSSNVLSLTVNKADTTASITNGASLSSTSSVTGEPVAVTYSVTGAFGNSPSAPTGNVTVSDGTDDCTGTVAAGTCSIAFTSVGAKTLKATYAGDTNFNTSPASTGVSHTVNKADTTTTISSDTPDPSVEGHAVTVDYGVTVDTPGAGTPTGNVTVSDGTDSCTATVAAGTCDITLSTAGPRTLTATYAGDTNFNGSPSAGESHTVRQPIASVADVTHDEGDSGTTTYTFTASLDATTDHDVTLHWATSDGTAHDDADYAADSGDLTILTGSTTKLFDVSVYGDTANEPDQTFTVTLSSPTGATVSLTNGSATGTITNDDTGAVCTVEGTVGDDPALTGTAGDDVLCGLAGDDDLYGGQGSDTLIGGPGTDTADYGAGTLVTSVVVDLTAGTAIERGPTTFTDALSEMENVEGTAGPDVISGDTGPNILSGGDGADRLWGRGGDDTLDGGAGDDLVSGNVGDDTLDGGPDVDLVNYRWAPAGVTVDLGITTPQDTGGGGHDVIVNVEKVRGSEWADTLTAAATGSSLIGGGGNDTLVSGPGSDAMLGGAGADTVGYSAAGSGITLDLAVTGAQLTGGGGSDTLARVENVTGSAFSDTIYGTVGPNVLAGGEGDNSLYGRKGDDTLTAGTGNDLLDGGGNATTSPGDACDADGGTNTVSHCES